MMTFEDSLSKIERGLVSLHSEVVRLRVMMGVGLALSVAILLKLFTP